MNILVTGGAGFIGSSIVDAFLSDGHSVRVLDNLSTGYLDNVGPAAEFLEGDVSDLRAVIKAVDGMEVVFHLAAHRAVVRSIEDPLPTDLANTHGTLTVLKASLDAGVRRVVYASSSSVYGADPPMPTPETAPPRPRSPYAVTKVAGEHYCRVFAELYGLETLCFRYFNIFGPRQRPDSAYAAVIPIFIAALRDGRRPTVHGDGRQCRAFTYIADVVRANQAAASAPAEACRGHVYNIAGAQSYSLLEVLDTLGRLLSVAPDPIYGDVRPGDIRDSRADSSLARSRLGWAPEVDFVEGLRRSIEWFEGRPQRDRTVTGG